MTAFRIIPATDDAAFPYEEALRLLEAIPGVAKADTDIPGIVAAGVKVGWPQSLVDWHWEVMEKGGVFDFVGPGDAGISCTLWADNIFFRFASASHEEASMPFIENLARTLKCRIIQQ